jgi:lipopolysaccharide transport system ATP-binding protein
MAEPVVAFRGVRKTFRLRNRSDALRDAIPRLLGRLAGRPLPPAKRFTALDDVSFHVDPGEVLGIVGANGAGKSTSLRIAAGVYRPDAGEVLVRGRVSALIELSAGFHPDLSGRENIFLVGALLGMRRKEMDPLVGPIAEFADIGEFLESPVRMYSTGMAVRLGFAVAAVVPAEVLLVDEVLAVGDIDFQAKCLRKMAERRERGVGVLFVSHNLQVVEQFCDRVLFVHHGKVAAEGAPREVLARFRRFLADEKSMDLIRESATPRIRRGTGDAKMDGIRVGVPGGPEGEAAPGAALGVAGTWRIVRPIPGPLLSVAIHTIHGALVHETRRPLPAGDAGAFAVEFPGLALLPGDYEVSVSLTDGSRLLLHDAHQRLYPLKVTGAPPDGQDGLVALGPRWTFGEGP